MKLLVELFGRKETERVLNDLKIEFPHLGEDTNWLIRNTILTLS